MKNSSKINNLITLKNAGLPVPEFSVVEYERIITNPAVIRSVFEKLQIKNSEETAFAMRKVIKSVAVRVTVPGLDKTCLYSVRSACVLEDSALASFAGQFDTFLNVPAADVPEKIIECVCSLYSPNVLDYLAKKNIKTDMPEMNVIVQKMVCSDLSGVIFTANPQGLLNETVIVAGKGLGDGVVSDRTDTTAYYYNTTDRIWYYDGQKDLLGSKLVEDLIDLSSRITGVLGGKLDIEYAVENGKCYILQARPITTLSDTAPLILDNSNIVESYPGLSLPLTADFVRSVYEGVFESAGRRLIKSRDELEKLRSVFANTVACVNGRMYYRLSNWYEIINYLPLRKKFLPIWQELIGVEYKDSFTPSNGTKFGIRAGIYLNAVREIFSAPKNMKNLHEKFLTIEKKVRKSLSGPLTNTEIFSLYDKIEKEILSDWGITLFNDTYAFLFTGILKRRLEKKYGKNSPEVTCRLAGIKDMESLKPVKAIMKLSLDKPNLTDEEYSNRRDEYIALYGDRSLEELKLESKTFRTNPELFDESVESYTSAPEKTRRMLMSFESRETSAKEDFITGILIKAATKGIANRERSRLDRGRIFGLVREAFLRAGEDLASKGLIEEMRDVFYLNMAEIRACGENPRSMKETVLPRKKKYETFAALPAYSRLVFSEKEFDKNPLTVNETAAELDAVNMKGIPCSDGKVTGEALVVTDPTAVKDARGKILITKMTDPGWVFLLSTAKAVVSEKGSLLSHTAIISREMGIPAVVGVSKLMDKVKSGDILTVDGTTGEVVPAA
ncbi:MAG: phosphoenolpyruvate synthase [Clostridiales bacterium]|nr:phosphoenolpyruvate synthase [Clostridiales bacterium]